MGDRTGIAWTDATWNPVRGCSRVSEGCRNCYAEAVAARFSHTGAPYFGFADHTRPGSKWTGKVELIPGQLDLPLRWRRPRRVFVNSMSDLFHESLADDVIDQVFGIMALAPQHTFQVLTKRPDRMRRWFERDRPRTAPAECLAAAYVENPALARRRPLDTDRAVAVGLAGWPLPNVWLGVSVEDQASADSRIPHLLQVPAAVRFLSCEPLLSAVDLRHLTMRDGWRDALGGRLHTGPAIISGEPSVQWVIVGGESGPGARTMRRQWADDLLRQCKAAGVPAFFKQVGSHRWGEWPPAITGKGDDLAEWPEGLRVQEFPVTVEQHD